MCVPQTFHALRLTLVNLSDHVSLGMYFLWGEDGSNVPFRMRKASSRAECSSTAIQMQSCRRDSGPMDSWSCCRTSRICVGAAEDVSAGSGLFLQFSLHHWILAMPQRCEGHFQVVGNGPFLPRCFFHKPTFELRRNTNIQRFTLYHWRSSWLSGDANENLRRRSRDATNW